LSLESAGSGVTSTKSKPVRFRVSRQDTGKESFAAA
jgi:hypothetical protein